MSAQEEKALYLDCAAMMREYGLGRALAERIMRHCPKLDGRRMERVDGGRPVRKTYVKRADVERVLEQLERPA